MIEKNYITLTPAYGRDYTSVTDVKTAFLNGCDFILQDVTSQWYGKPTNVLDMKPGTKVRIRYFKLARVATFEVPSKEATARYLEAKRESGRTRW